MNKNVNTITQEILDFLQLPLNLSTKNIPEHTEKIVQFQARLLPILVQSRKELSINSAKYRHPKDKEYTDFDRRILLEDMLSDDQYSYDLLSGLSELLRSRVEVLLSLARLLSS